MTLTVCVRVRKPKRLPEAQAAWANCISLLAVVVVRPFYGCSDPGMPLSSNGNSVEACSPPFPGPLSHGRLSLLYRPTWRCQEWDRLTACAPVFGRTRAGVGEHPNPPARMRPGRVSNGRPSWPGQPWPRDAMLRSARPPIEPALQTALRAAERRAARPRFVAGGR